MQAEQKAKELKKKGFDSERQLAKSASMFKVWRSYRTYSIIQLLALAVWSSAFHCLHPHVTSWLQSAHAHATKSSKGPPHAQHMDLRGNLAYVSAPTQLAT